MDNIEFRVILSYPGYEVSRCGVVRHKKRRRILKQWPVFGYLNVTVAQNRKQCKRRVHRLVAEVFLPNPENKPFINHIDGNKLNNALSNLEWCTNQENLTHALAAGIMNKAEQHRKAKDSVIEIRCLLASGLTQREVSDRLGVKQKTVGKIHRGESHGSV
jgi:DNA-binding NarL/FixJ family response regulator